ncbi:hypothetical protein D9M71_395640 [compost metagenome]
MLVLLGDIGQVEELVERPRHRHQLVFGEAVEGGGQLPRPFGRATPRRLGALADQFDLVEESLAVLVADGLPQQFAQVVHILAQTRVDFRHGDSPFAVFFRVKVATSTDKTATNAKASVRTASRLKVIPERIGES